MIQLKTLLINKQKNVEALNLTNNSFHKSFPLFNHLGECKYQNLVSSQKSSSEGQSINKIKITNKLCSGAGDIFQKTTTIKFNNQVIIIRDLYSFESLGIKAADISGQKRVQIFKKPLIDTSKDAPNMSKLTKNLPKNFIKAFLNYIQVSEDINKKQLLQCKIKVLINRQKFNNSLIQKIIDDQELYPYFCDFLSNHATDWIQNSKIANKKSHISAIKVFLQLRPKVKASHHIYALESSNRKSGEEEHKQYVNQDSRMHESDKESIICNSSQSNESQSF